MAGDELADESRLTDASRSEQGEQVGCAPGDNAVEHALEHLELPLPSDHRRIQVPNVASRVLQDLDKPERTDRLRLAL